MAERLGECEGEKERERALKKSVFIRVGRGGGGGGGEKRRGDDGWGGGGGMGGEEEGGR